MNRIPRSDPRAAHIARHDTVTRSGLDDFVAPRHRWVLATERDDGRPQLSPVSGGLVPDGRLVVATYPTRAKAANVRHRPNVSVTVLSDDWNGPWVQVDGTASVVEAPEALDDFVAYYRSISGEHPDWDEYRRAMAEQGKCLLSIEVTRWGPIAGGGFPESMFEPEG